MSAKAKRSRLKTTSFRVEYRRDDQWCSEWYLWSQPTTLARAREAAAECRTAARITRVRIIRVTEEVVR